MLGQQQRDEKSIHIFIGLLLCALLTVMGLGLLWVADDVFKLSEGLAGDLSGAVLGSAVLVAIVYVFRHRRP